MTGLSCADAFRLPKWWDCSGCNRSHRLVSFRPPKRYLPQSYSDVVSVTEMAGLHLVCLGTCRVRFEHRNGMPATPVIRPPPDFVSATEMWRPTMRLHSQGTGAFRSPKQYLPRSYSDVVSVTEMVSPHPRYQTGYRSSFRSPKRHTAVISGKPLIASV